MQGGKIISCWAINHKKIVYFEAPRGIIRLDAKDAGSNLPLF